MDIDPNPLLTSSVHESDRTGLRGLGAITWRHRVAVLLGFALTFGGAVVYVLRKTPVYSCTPAVLEIVSGNAGIATIKDVFERQLVTAQHFETQMNLMRSDGVLRAAYATLPRVAPVVSFASFARAVDIRAVRNSYLVEVTFDSPWCELNPECANAIAEAYVETARAQREERTSRASLELGRRRDATRAQLDECEHRIAKFRSDCGVVDLHAEKEKLDKLLSDFEARYDQQQLELVRVESAHHEVEAARRANSLTQVGEVQKDPGFQELERLIREAEGQRFTTLRDFKEDSPQVVLLSQQLASLKQRRDELIAAIIGNIETAYENAQRATRRIEELRNARRDEQRELGRQIVALTNFESERSLIQRNLEDLLRQTGEVQGASGFDLSPAIIWGRAGVDRAAIHPRPLRDLSLAFGLALLLGAGVAFLREYLSDTVDRPEEIARTLRAPVLGILPRVAKRNGEADLITVRDPGSDMAEAIRIIRTAILYAPSGRKPRKRILVTSAEPGDGKTTTAINLALALAQAGEKTLLLDADLRNPRVHRVFHLHNEAGLTDIFRQGHRPQPLSGLGDAPELHVIPSGPIPQRPAELLSDRRFAQFLDQMAQSYDRVVIDSPPAAPVSDPALLAQWVDSVIVVVEAQKTSLRALRRGRDHLLKVGAPILGVVLNGVASSAARSYGYYSYRSRCNPGHGKPRAELASQPAVTT